MGFLGLEVPKAAPGYRKRRFLAFVIDLAVIVVIWYISFSLTGKPDFLAVKTAMDAANILTGTSQQTALTEVFAKYDVAFQFGLILWFAYDAIFMVASNGRTLGKFLMGMQIVPTNPERNRLLSIALLILRAFIKALSLYIFQAIPFAICALTVFASSNRSGFDSFVKTEVVDVRKN